MKYKSQLKILLTGSLLLLGACSASSDTGGTADTGGTGNTAPTTAPAAPVVTASVEAKTVVLSWTSVSGATSYRVESNPDGGSGYTQVGSDLAGDATTSKVSVPVHLTSWGSAKYIVEACNSAGCTSSNEITSLDALAAIGYLKASNTDSGDNFGWSVAVSGDGSTVAVGAWQEAGASSTINGNESNNSASSAGAVYVYEKIDGSWAYTTYIKAPNTDANDNFGNSVSLDQTGDHLLVGAPGEASNATGYTGPSGDNSAPKSGAAYIFTRSSGPGSSWNFSAYLKASNTEGGDNFGEVVSISDDGNTVAIGASYESGGTTGINANQADNSAANAGAVYVFAKHSGGTWAQESYVKSSNTDAGDRFGSAIALSSDGNTLAVGTYYEASAAQGMSCNADSTDTNPANGIPDCQEDNSASDSGAVYVFSRSGTTWSQQAYIKASNADATDFFGHAISISNDGNTLAVGAYNEGGSANGIYASGDTSMAVNSAAGAGAVYLFTRSGSTWTEDKYVKASDTEAGDYFGYSVALSGDGNAIAIGAPLEASSTIGVDTIANNSALNAGAAYVYTKSAGSWVNQAHYIKASNTESQDFFGATIAVNDDGTTLAVSAFGEASAATGIGGDQTDNTKSTSGAVYLY